ncbi:hypothetical protein ACFS32_24765 [Novosphingobium pokkalii]
MTRLPRENLPEGMGGHGGTPVWRQPGSIRTIARCATFSIMSRPSGRC